MHGAPKCCAARTPRQDRAGRGGAQRPRPTGGAAKGTPAKKRTPPASRRPMIRPVARRTWGAGEAEAEAEFRAAASHTPAASKTASGNKRRRDRRKSYFFPEAAALAARTFAQRRRCASAIRFRPSWEIFRIPPPLPP